MGDNGQSDEIGPARPLSCSMCHSGGACFRWDPRAQTARRSRLPSLGDIPIATSPASGVTSGASAPKWPKASCIGNRAILHASLPALHSANSRAEPRGFAWPWLRGKRDPNGPLLGLRRRDDSRRLPPTLRERPASTPVICRPAISAQAERIHAREMPSVKRRGGNGPRPPMVKPSDHGRPDHRKGARRATQDTTPIRASRPAQGPLRPPAREARCAQSSRRLGRRG